MVEDEAHGADSGAKEGMSESVCVDFPSSHPDPLLRYAQLRHSVSNTARRHCKSTETHSIPALYVPLRLHPPPLRGEGSMGFMLYSQSQVKIKVRPQSWISFTFRYGVT